MNPYRVLGVSSLSTKSDIKLSYRKLCKKYHPDNLETGDESKFREVFEAWDYISKYHKDGKNSKEGKPMWKHKSLFSIYKEEV